MHFLLFYLNVSFCLCVCFTFYLTLLNNALPFENKVLFLLASEVLVYLYVKTRKVFYGGLCTAERESGLV